MNEENMKRGESLTDSLSALTKWEFAKVICFVELIKNRELYEQMKCEAAKQGISVCEYVDKVFDKTQE